MASQPPDFTLTEDNTNIVERTIHVDVDTMDLHSFSGELVRRLPVMSRTRIEMRIGQNSETFQALWSACMGQGRVGFDFALLGCRGEAIVSNMVVNSQPGEWPSADVTMICEEIEHYAAPAPISLNPMLMFTGTPEIIDISLPERPAILMADPEPVQLGAPVRPVRREIDLGEGD